LFILVNCKNYENKITQEDNSEHKHNLEYIASNLEEKFCVKINMVNLAVYSFDEDFKLAKFINNCLIKKSGVGSVNKSLKKASRYKSSKVLPRMNHLLLEKENKSFNDNLDVDFSHNSKYVNNLSFEFSNKMDSQETQKQRKYKYNNENRDLSASPKKSKKNRCLLF